MKKLKMCWSVIAVMAILAFTFTSAIAVSPSSTLNEVDDEDAAILGELAPAPPGNGWLLRPQEVPLPAGAALTATLEPTDPLPVSPANAEILTLRCGIPFTAAEVQPI